MQKNESILITAIRKMAETKRIKKQLLAINQSNEARRGVTEYLPSKIEGFFDVNEPLGNVIVSGGDNSIRCCAVSAATACVFAKGYPVIVLHCGNGELECELQNMFAPSLMCVFINRSNPVYDPLTSLSNSEISQLLVQAGSGIAAIPPGGRYYIEALAEFLRCKGIDPYCKMFFTCPHQQLAQAIDSAVAAGQLTVQLGQQIKSLIMQGQQYRSTIETFFARLEQQSSHIMCGKSQLNRRLSLYECAKKRLVTVVDLSTDTNDILINLVSNEIERLLAAGLPLCLAIDDISLSANENMSRLLRSVNSNFWKVVSSKDFYTMTGSNDALFSDITNSAQKVIISSHSGLCCTKWSSVLGEYDKEEISESFSSSSRYHTFFSVFPGQDNSRNLTVSQKREQIVKPEDLARMASNEVYVINRNANEIAHTVITS